MDLHEVPVRQVDHCKLVLYYNSHTQYRRGMLVAKMNYYNLRSFDLHIDQRDWAVEDCLSEESMKQRYRLFYKLLHQYNKV